MAAPKLALALCALLLVSGLANAQKGPPAFDAPPREFQPRWGPSDEGGQRRVGHHRSKRVVMAACCQPAGLFALRRLPHIAYCVPSGANMRRRLGRPAAPCAGGCWQSAAAAPPMIPPLRPPCIPAAGTNCNRSCWKANNLFGLKNT